MASPNNQTIPIIVKSTDHGYNCAYVITQGDTSAYILTITYSDIEAFDGTVLLRFVMPDGTYHDRDDSDGVTVDGNVITYTMAEADYAQRGMVCYVRHLDSTTLHTTLKITFSQIRALEGETAGTDTTSYPTWAADMRDLDFAIGTVETLAPGTDATASITGDVPDKVLNLGIPQGVQGDAASVEVGTVSTLAAGESATVSNSGTSAAAVLDFGIPQGVKGDTGEMTIGTVTTLAPGESATVTNAGTSTDAVLDIGIPAGYDGSAVPVDDASTAADRVLSAQYVKGQLSAIVDDISGLENGTGIDDGAITGKKLDLFEDPVNLFDRFALTSGYVISSTGIVTANTGYAISDFVPIEAGETYAWLKIFRMSYYNSSYVYVGQIAGDTNSTAGGIAVPPATSAYVRFSVAGPVPGLHVNGAQFVKGLSLSRYETGYGLIKHLFAPNAFIKIFWLSYPMVDMPINTLYQSDVTIADGSATVDGLVSSDIFTLYDALVTADSDYVTKSTLGNDSSGSPIYQYRFTPQKVAGPSQPMERFPIVFITSGVHGNEKTAVITLYNVMNNIVTNWSADPLLEAIRFNFDMIIIPICNPYGFDNAQRKNYNGVDLARNFPSGWIASDPAAIDYGGTAPLTQVEAQYINQILMKEIVSTNYLQERITKLTAYIDFHNFGRPSDDYYFIWGAASNNFTRACASLSITKIDRHWKTKYNTFINADHAVLIGNLVGTAPGGSPAAQASQMGVKASGTYEVCDKVFADGAGARNDSNTLSMAYEAFINYLLTIVNQSMIFWHKQLGY